MTVIVGLVSVDSVVMGSDKMAGNGWDLPSSLCKFKQRDGWTIATTGSPWLLEVAMLVDRDLWEGNNPFNFCRGLRKKLTEENWEFLENKGGPREIGSGLMLSHSGKLWVADADLFPHESPVDEMSAIGCGADFALGANAVLPTNLLPRNRVKRCIEVANKLSVRCGLGIDIIEIKN